MKIEEGINTRYCLHFYTLNIISFTCFFGSCFMCQIHQSKFLLSVKPTWQLMYFCFWLWFCASPPVSSARLSCNDSATPLSHLSHPFHSHSHHGLQPAGSWRCCWCRWWWCSCSPSCPGGCSGGVILRRIEDRALLVCWDPPESCVSFFCAVEIQTTGNPIMWMD